MSDLVDTLLEIKKKCRDVSYMGVGLIVDTENKLIPYVIGTGGRVYSNAASVMAELAGMGVDAYIASGDSMRNLSKLAAKLNMSIDRVFDVATPRRKESIVRGLRERYDKVVMVGDAINDIPAMRASHLGILSIQQEGVCRSQRLLEEADAVIKDIGEVPAIVRRLL